MTKFKLPDDLYEFQKEDADKMCGENPAGKNWLNFSEMGVGKTPETIATIEQNKYNLPLITGPNSLRLEWGRQIGEWVGEGTYAVSRGNSYTRMGPIIHSLTRGQKYKIINYESLRNEFNREMLSMIPFDCLVFDEIHKLRNPKTKLVKRVWEFLENYPDIKIIGLSGSPIMNYPSDLYVPLSVCYPDRYPRNLRSWRIFMYKYCLWADGRHGPYVYGTRNLPQLREETAPFIIRRTKKEVLPFLPDKYYQRIELDMKADQKKLYNQMESELKILLDTGEPLWSTSILSTLTRLRQINLDPKIVGVSASSAKTEFLYDMIDSTDSKLVIYSCFEKYIYLLHLVLEEQGIPHIVITGEVPPDDRIRRVQDFQNKPEIRVCLGTIQTMGEGITLTASSTVILADRWWNEPTNQQAVDRLHRIGQKNAVQVIIPICRNSIEETLNQILLRKDEASEQYYRETVVREKVMEGIQ